MDGTRYVVELDLRQVGKWDIDRYGKGAERTRVAMDGMGARLRESSPMVDRLTDSFRRAESAAMGIGIRLGVVGAAAGVGALTYGVLGLNVELEKTRASLGTIFSVQGFAKDVPNGIRLAGEVIAKMREDAVALPGEFEDLMQIFQLGSVPAFQSGLDPDSWRKLSAKVMAAAAVTSMPMDQAAREFAALLEGRSGAQNVFGMKLLGLSGDKAEEFNKKSREDRVTQLGSELDKYGSAIPVLAGTWDAISSTAATTLKLFAQVSTLPVFERLKKDLAAINTWVEANQHQIALWADYLGFRLGEAYDAAKQKLLEWGPIIYDFGVRLWDAFGQVWIEIEPYVVSIAGALKEALGDPESVNKLIELAKMYMAIRVGLAGMEIGASGLGLLQKGVAALGAASAAKGIMGGIGALAGTGAAGGAVAAGGAAAGAGAGGLLAIGAATPGAAAVVGAGGGAAAVAALGAATVGVIAAGAAAWAYALYNAEDTLDSWSAHLNADDRARADSLVAFTTESTIAQMQLVSLSEAVLIATEGYHSLALAQAEELERSGAFVSAAEESTLALYDMGMQAIDTANSLASLAHTGGLANTALNEKLNQDALDMARVLALGGGYKGKAIESEVAKRAGSKEKQGKSGGTSIQKVEIVVTSNKDPNRIALEVKDVLVALGKRPTRSPGVPNYSKG